MIKIEGFKFSEDHAVKNAPKELMIPPDNLQSFSQKEGLFD